MPDGIDYEKLNKPKKTALSITIDTELLEWLKEDMKKAGFEDMPVSAVFNDLLGTFKEAKKKYLEKKEMEKKEDDKPQQKE